VYQYRVSPIVRVLHLVRPGWAFGRFHAIRSQLSSVDRVLRLVGGFAVAVVDADARSRVSFGSRGSKTFTAPRRRRPRPIRHGRSSAPWRSPHNQPLLALRRLRTRPRLRALVEPAGYPRQLCGGFLGAGLIGFCSATPDWWAGRLWLNPGLLLQIASLSELATCCGRGGSAAASRPWRAGHRCAMPALAADGLGGLAGLGVAVREPPFVPTASDFQQFERLLGEIQTAYGAEDLGRLRQRVTPECCPTTRRSWRQHEPRRAQRISDVKLLQGDLSSLARRQCRLRYRRMRYSLNDEIVDRASGRVTEAGRTKPPRSGPSCAWAAVPGCFPRFSRSSLPACTSRTDMTQGANLARKIDSRSSRFGFDCCAANQVLRDRAAGHLFSLSCRRCLRIKLRVMSELGMGFRLSV